MHDPSSDFRRLQAALDAQWGIEDVARRPAGARAAAEDAARRASGRSPSPCATARATSSRSGPACTSAAYGLAVDIGSTTIAAHLVRPARPARCVASAGLMNPQIRFGEDLMSRVSYVMMNPGGDEEMTAAVREALDSARRRGLRARPASTRDDILEMTVVGNPDHAPPLPRHRPGRARRRALRARHRRRLRDLPRARARPHASTPGAMVYVAALHRRPCRRRRRRRRAVGRPVPARTS